MNQPEAKRKSQCDHVINCRYTYVIQVSSEAMLVYRVVIRSTDAFSERNEASATNT